MAGDEDLDFKEFLSTVRKNMKKAANKSGQASSSPAPAQASASQPETKKPTPSHSQGPNIQVREVKYNNRVGRVAFMNCCDTAMDAAMAGVGGGEPANHGEPADGNEGGYPDSSTPSKSNESRAKPSEANEGRAKLSMEEVLMLGQRMLSGMTTASDKPCGSDHSPVQRGTSPPPDHAPDSFGGRPAEPTQKASIRGYQKPSASPLRNEDRGSPADDDQQASQHNKTENGTATSSPETPKRGERGALPLHAGSKEIPPFSSSANPTLEDSSFSLASMIALAARVDEFIGKYMLKDKQQSTLLNVKEKVLFVMFYLRQRRASHEDYATLPDQALVKAFAFAGDEEACDWMRRAGWEIIFLKEVPLYQERATDESVIPVFGKPVQAAKVDRPTASAHLPTKPEVHKKLEKTAQKKFEGIDMSHPQARDGSNADQYYLVPPLVSQKGKVILCLHPSLSGSDQLAGPRFREQGTGLSADEWEKVPNEFRHLDREILEEYWDLAYNPVVRKRVIDYKRVLALAGKADEILDEANKLLAALVDIEEAEIQKGVEHAVAVSENKTSEHQLGGSAMTEEFMEPSGTNTLAAALIEIDKSFLDPSYNITTARENFALSKGVKLNSVEVYEFFHQYQKLRTSYYSSQTNTTRGDKKMTLLQQMILLELKAFDNGKEKESGPGIGEASSSEVKGKEGDLLVEEASAIGKAKTKGKKKSGKGGKKKKSKLLMDDAATDKGKERDMLVEGSTVHEGKGKGKELPLLEDATAGKGKAKESNVLVKDQANGKGKGKENDLPVKDTTSGKGKEGEQSSSSGFRKFKLTLDLNTEPQLKPSSTLVVDLGGSRPTVDDVTEIFSKFSAIKGHYLGARTSLLCFMIDKVRPQEASSDELDVFCQILSAQVVFDDMSLAIEELKWNRAVVEYPNNPMITEVLQRTQHLRPTNGLHHPLGISIAPLLMPQYPPLPPGPAPATPVVTTPTKEQLQEQRKKPQSVMEQIKEQLQKPSPIIEQFKEQLKKVEPLKEQPQKVQPMTVQPTTMERPQKEQPKKQRTGVVALPKIPIKVKLPFEDPMDVLELRRQTILAKIGDGTPIEAAKINADLVAIQQEEQYLRNKAAMEPAGGPSGLMLAERQRQMAEAIGAPDWLLP